MAGKLFLIAATLALAIGRPGLAEEKGAAKGPDKGPAKGAAKGGEKGSEKGAEKGREEEAPKGGRALWAVVQAGDDLLSVQEDKIPALQKEIAKENRDKPQKKGKPEPRKTFKLLKKNFPSYEEAEKFRLKLEEKEQKKSGKGTKGGKSEKQKPDKKK